MSAVRMCDKDGTIFAEGAEGSTTGVMVRNVRNPVTQRIEQVERYADFCPACSNGETPTPRLPAIESGHGDVNV